MNFTREPIIETVITPREGCKLVVRSSKGATQEDYFVDAVEVVSFGHSFFFRSTERPKSFLVPVSDYEILELKETRMVLKNATTERSIKIGGGREAPPRQRDREQEPRDDQQPVAADGRQPGQDRQQQDRQPMDRDRKRGRGRRGRRGRDRDRSEPMPLHQDENREANPEEEPNFEPVEASQEAFEGEPFAQQEEHKAPSFISKLFPPPPTLIKDSLSRYKPAEGAEEGELFPPSSEEPVVFEEKTTFEESIFEHPEIPENDSDEQRDSEE